MKTALGLIVLMCGGLGLASTQLPRIVATAQEHATALRSTYDKVLFPDRPASSPALPLPDGARVWRDDMGRMCEATMIGVCEGMVRLRRTDGRVGDWPFYRLSRRDQEWVRKHQKS